MPALTAANLSAESVAVGTRRSSREPLPSWPNPPYPQQATLLSDRTPQLYAPPVTRVVKLAPPATLTGATRVLPELSPTWPLKLSPQQ